jgi:hypothetical protein
MEDTVSRRASWIVASFCVLAASHPAHGLAVLADERSVVSCLNRSCGGVMAEFLAPFDVSFPPAGQTSSITVSPDGLGLEGSATGRAAGVLNEFELIEGSTIFSITFRIHGDGEFSLQGDLTAFGAGGSDVSVHFLSGEDVVFEAHPTGDFSFAAHLEPGDYALEASAFGSFDNFYDFELAFQVRDSTVPIPEPGTSLVLSMGVTALAIGRRRMLVGQRMSSERRVPLARLPCPPGRRDRRTSSSHSPSATSTVLGVGLDS